MAVTEQGEWCTYAAVCRIPASVRSCAPLSLQPASDLLVAIAQHHLHIFARRLDRPSSGCTCHARPNETANASVALLGQNGFICPHVTAYDDVVHALTIPTSAISQVFMTYRTATAPSTASSFATGKGVATRTRDLVLRATSSLVVWLEFEHNLARGWFLEALTRAAVKKGSSTLELEYLDFSDEAAVTSITSQVSTPQQLVPFLPKPLAAPSALAFLRDAWRHVTYEKIKLALQVAHDTPSATCDNSTVSCFLTTAMELSTRLEEPDLNAFTWLTSGFLNMRASPPATTKHDLALAQLVHSIDLARENSLDYITCLALQCLANAYLQNPDTVTRARDLLVEATKLLTVSSRCAAMESSLKMQLHATLRELTSSNGAVRPTVQRAQSVLASAPTSLFATKSREQFAVGRVGSSSTLMDKSRCEFSLWAHVFGNAGAASAGGEDSIKRLVLARVLKPLRRDEPGGSFFVDVLGAHAVRKARFRVFFDAASTAEWLRDHVTIRYRAVVSTAPDEGDAAVELIYDPQKKQVVPTNILLAEWFAPTIATSEYTLHAKLAPRVVSSHRSSYAGTAPMERTPASATSPPSKSAKAKTDEQPESPTVVCSLCGRRIPLNDVEDHSDTCYGVSL